MKKLLPFLFGAVAALSIAYAVPELSFAKETVVRAPQAQKNDVYRALNLFGDVFERVRGDYVDKDKAEAVDKLIDDAIRGMVEKLDPHSSYMNAKEFQDMRQQTSGEFGGLGIEVQKDGDAIKVVSPIDDTPAQRAGILSGDRITHIDDEPVASLSLNDAVGKMKGAVNTQVRLKIARKGVEQPLDVTLTRAIIQVMPVKSHTDGGDIGYIKLSQFSEKTVAGMRKAVKSITAEIPSEQLKGYVLDLRNDPGGLLDQAIWVCDALLPRGEIVSLRGRNPEDVQRFPAHVKERDLIDNKPLIVLMNGGSASASEIVGGCLQDHKRATILGTRSFGKGSVQTILPLGTGQGALRLTTARYFTPSGASIQAKGIHPDIEVLQVVPEELKAKVKDMEGEASLKDHLKIEGQQEETGSQSFIPLNEADDKALHAAYDLLRGTTTDKCFPANSVGCTH